MAVTKLTDIVQHDKEFLATVMQKMTDKSVLRAAGVIANNPDLDARAAGAGKITSIPFYNTLTQTESSVGSDDDSAQLTLGKITQGEQLAVRNFRNAGWSSMDLVAQLLADDPMDAIAARVGEYWAQDEERMVLSMLKGILADDEAGSDVLYAGDGLGNLDIDLLIDAAGTAGDAAGQFNTLIIHSAIHRQLQKTQANAYVPKAATDLGFATYAGYRLVVTDLMPLSAGVYTSVLCAPGAVLAGEAAAKVPVAAVRDELAGNGSGQDKLITRRQFILHPNGMKFDSGSVAGNSPTNAELENAANWSQAYARKNIGLAFIKSAIV